MAYGYVMTQDLFNRLANQSVDFIQEVYNDLLSGINKATGGTGHEPIYRSFPKSVVEMPYIEFLINAVIQYWSLGTWRPEDKKYIERDRKLEFVEYTKVGLITQTQYDSIFTDLIYSGSSLSQFDKEIVDFFIQGGVNLDFGKISFKETSAYVGQRLMAGECTLLPTMDATAVLRIWSAYSGGDEGLKENTKFKNPKAFQRRVLLRTLDQCTNLEESFKIYREKWLRLLYFLNPLEKKKAITYPHLHRFAGLLRNEPKKLRTFNSYVEEKLANNDISVLELLKKRKGAFMRRLDHLVRTFGLRAIGTWLECNPTFLQMVNTYNHFTDRDKEQAGRGAVLASQSKSEVVTYDALAPLDTKVVSTIKVNLLDKLKSIDPESLPQEKAYIDRALYYRPLATNNRASSFSLQGKAVGTVEKIKDSAKTIRMFCHWEGRYDIDLSGMIIDNQNNVTKVGWNGNHHFQEAVIYSGDNQGYADKNAEYLDIVPSKLPSNTEWVIVDSVVYSGPKFKGQKVHAGWMTRQFPEANDHWLPQTISNATSIQSDSKSAYLMALHVPSNNIVYLDLSMQNTNVTSAEDALRMRIFLDQFVTLDNGEDEIQWDKINQGHVIDLLFNNKTTDAKEADIVFDENTTWEQVSTYLTQ